MTESQQRVASPAPAAAPAAAPPPHSQRPSKPPAAPLRPVIFIAAVFLVVMGISLTRQHWVAEEKVKWREDLRVAMTESRETNKPVLLYFTASWCGPCQWMRREVFTEASVARASDAYVPVRIDGDRNPELALAYGVESYPLFLVLDAQGRPTRIADRGMDADEMIAWLAGK